MVRLSKPSLSYPSVSTNNQRTSEMFKELIGRTITDVRDLTQDEKDEMDWYGECPVLILDNGQEVTISQDPEGNGPGFLFID